MVAQVIVTDGESYSDSEMSHLGYRRALRSEGGRGIRE